MAHSWATNFLLSLPLLFFSGSTTILTFYFVSAVLFSLFCSPFLSHFVFQKLLSKPLLSFSQLINLLFTFPFSTSPLVFLWNLHLWASERLRAEHPWGRRGGGSGTCGWEPEGPQLFWKTSLAICLIPPPHQCPFLACELQAHAPFLLTQQCASEMNPCRCSPWTELGAPSELLSQALCSSGGTPGTIPQPPGHTTKCQRLMCNLRGKIGTTKNKSTYGMYGVPNLSRWQWPLFQAWSSVFLYLHFYGQKQLNQFKIVI